MALWVVIYHIATISGVSVTPLLSGHHAVIVFFALSGFVVSKLAHEKHESRLVFLIRRWFRLFPAYAVALAIGIGLSAASVMPDRTEPGSEHLHIISHLLLFHGLVPEGMLPGASGSYLNPAWSVSVEWQFYLVFPLLYSLVFVRSPLGAATLLTIGYVGLRAWPFFQYNGHPIFGLASLVPNLPYFLAGMLSYQAFHWLVSNKSQIAKHGNAIALLVPLCSALFVSTQDYVGLLIWLTALGLVVSASLSQANQMPALRGANSFLSSRMMVALGTISYSLYLIHEPVIWLVRTAILALDPSISTSMITLLTGMISVPVSLFSATCMYQFVERSGIAFGNRIAERISPRSTE